MRHIRISVSSMKDMNPVAPVDRMPGATTTNINNKNTHHTYERGGGRENISCSQKEGRKEKRT